MILVDKNIKELSANGQLISSGYVPGNVNSISYDLTLGGFLNSNENKMDLIPGQFLMIKTNEELKIPTSITGRVGEKNSLMRIGLKVDGPQYQPGHTTYAFLRVQNVSDNIITLRKGMKIAQIYFEELKEIPDQPYNVQPGASFNNENSYLGFGMYDSEYRKSIKSFKQAKEDIENLSNKIYGNVLTLMGLLVAVFSMLTINYEAFANASLTPNYVIAMNLSLTFCIVVMFGLLLLLVNAWKKKWFCVFYAAILLGLGVATILVFLI